ncbi:MAG TPA: DUF2938 domain-containing protein [Gemmatimonadales bacterium]
MSVLAGAAIGAGATAVMDLWNLLLRRAFGIPSLDYCLLGRWLLHMPTGTFRHASIARAESKPYECQAGWIGHYGIGVTLGVAFLILAPAGWLTNPTLPPALIFGLVTVVLPYFLLQPALGLGIAGARTPKPAQARVKSLATHVVFGIGLFASAWLLSRI